VLICEIVFIVVVLMLRNGGAQTRIGGAPRAKESQRLPEGIAMFGSRSYYN